MFSVSLDNLYYFPLCIKPCQCILRKLLLPILCPAHLLRCLVPTSPWFPTIRCNEMDVFPNLPFLFYSKTYFQSQPLSQCSIFLEKRTDLCSLYPSGSWPWIVRRSGYHWRNKPRNIVTSGKNKKIESHQLFHYGQSPCLHPSYFCIILVSNSRTGTPSY